MAGWLACSIGNRSSMVMRPEQAVKQAETVYASATIREALAKMVDKSASLLVVLSTDETPIGIVTLHDIVRLLSQVTDAM